MQPLIIPYKPLARCGIEELAAQQATNDRRKRQFGGVMYARKEHTEKRAATDEILRHLTMEAMPERISILSMPGLEWPFEARLLKRRDPHWRMQLAIDNTRFTCVENDRFIYYSATTRMPGNRHCGVNTLVRPPYAERAMGQGVIDRFVFANVDDLMQDRGESFDVAWLDYTGPLSIERMKVIERFWESSVRRLLVVTSLKARWNKETSQRIQRHGGCLAWQRARLPGIVLHEIEYQDGASPMAQIAISKAWRTGA